MNRRLFVLGLMLAAFAQSVTSQEPVFQRELLVGSWKVNWEKSKPEAGVTASQLPSIYRQYEEQGEGFMLHTVIMVDAAQKHAWTLIGVIKYDGKEYPTYAGKSLADRLASGKQPLETVAFRVVDAYNLEWTDRTNGKLTGTGTVALSKDGKTMTDTNRAYDSDGKEISMQFLVYAKQPEDQ